MQSPASPHGAVIIAMHQPWRPRPAWKKLKYIAPPRKAGAGSNLHSSQINPSPIIYFSCITRVKLINNLNMSLKIQKLNKQVAMERLKIANLAHWLEDPTTWDKEKFSAEVNQAMVDAYGLDVAFDTHLITMLTDQMDTYVKAASALMTEPLIELANNGARMSNPNQKVRDAALARIMQLLTMLGLVPAGRPKRSNAPTEIDELLAGP